MAGWRIAEDAEAIGRVREYLDGIENLAIGVAAGLELRKHFDRLVDDPRLGSAPTGPFESRPVYRFVLEAGDARRAAAVSYTVEADGSIIILAFTCSRI